MKIALSFLILAISFLHFSATAATLPKPTQISTPPENTPSAPGTSPAPATPAPSAPAPAAQNETAEFAIGLGYQLCGDDPMLPLDMSFYCPSAEPNIENVQVIMTPQKAAQPDWSFYEGTYTTDLEYDGVKVKVELSVELSSADGKKYAYIDGRIINDHGKKPIYFRAAADENFDNFSYLTYYGEQVPIKSGKDTFYFAPHLVIRKKIPANRSAQTPKRLASH